MTAPRIALIGSRGIPARYGGFETLLEEIAPRLVERGFEVTVYCRSGYTPASLREFRGARLVTLPTIRGKYFDTPVHTLLSCLHAAARRFDAALVVNGANVIFLPVLSAAGTATALHVDGVEKRRAKWGPLGRAVYALSERLATILPTRLVTDAEVIREHYLGRFGCPSTLITYGVDPLPLPPGAVMSDLGLESRRFFLYVSRFEPENNPHRVAEAYRQVGGDLPLVMVGGAPYARSFIAGFTARADSRIAFPGPIYGDGYRELLSHPIATIHATEVGGTHPALVEAMGYGNCVVVNETPENRETAGDAAVYFRVTEPSTLIEALERIRREPDLAGEMGARAARRAIERFSWPRIADRYEALFRDLCAA